jgi:N-acetylglucosamine kinase
MRPHTATQTQPQVLLKQAQFVLGIDAGATKTAAAIGSTQKVYGTGKSGPGNLHTTKPDDIIKNIQAAIEQAAHHVKSTGKLQFQSVVVGMAGIDSPYDQLKAERIVKKALTPWLASRAQLEVCNDIHLVRRSGSDDPYGIAIIAGTGSHCFGLNHKGEMAHSGGLEMVLSDEGSGYDMGLKVLRSAIRSADGRIKPTKLQQAVLKQFKVASVRSLEPIVYHGHGLDKSKVAKLAKLVDDLATTDWRAKEIINETLEELVLMVSAVVQRLQMKRMPFDVVVAGGIFEISSVPFLKRFVANLKTVAPHATVIKPQHPPVWGAVRLASDRLAS